jgi:hypothetical protein
VELDQSLYALDSTTIDLCLALFPWAKFRQRKAAVKMHTLLDLRGSIPAFISITPGRVHDVNILDEILPENGAFYVMDRAYLDFQRLYLFTLSGACFVVRTKSNVLLRRRYSRPVDKNAGLRSDHLVVLTAIDSAKAYPDPLRRVTYLDPETRKRFQFLTNNFTLPALTIAAIYKCRWQVELFFKWIKQHLRIKAFYGTSENAVKTQIWIAVSVYVLVAIVRKKLRLEASLYQILQILSVTLFEKTPILQASVPTGARSRADRSPYSPRGSSEGTQRTASSGGRVSGFATREKETRMEARVHAQPRGGRSRLVRRNREPDGGGDSRLPHREKEIAGDYGCAVEKNCLEV